MMSIFRKISIFSTVISGVCLLIAAVMVGWQINSEIDLINSLLFSILGWLLIIFVPLSVVANVIDKSVNKRPLSVVDLFNLIAWLLLLLYVLAMNF